MDYFLLWFWQKTEYSLYCCYGPCTSVAIFFKRDAYLSQLHEIHPSLGILDYRSKPSSKLLVRLSPGLPTSPSSVPLEADLVVGSAVIQDDDTRNSDDDDSDDSGECQSGSNVPTSVNWTVFGDIKWPSIQDDDFDIAVSVYCSFGDIKQ